jgi:transcriptional regulator with XRE-family HTH domain
VSDATEFYVVLGRRIKTAREVLGATQADLSKKCGLSRTSITNIETGRQHLSVHRLAELAAILGVPLGNLVPPPSGAATTQWVAARRRAELRLKAARAAVQAIDALMIGADPDGAE